MDYYAEIWKMQGDLNCIVGRDSINSPDASNWLYDFAQACEDEIVEAKNCISWKWWSKEGKENHYGNFIDKKNVNIELIDCLHFLMSMSHVIKLTPEKVGDIISEKYKIATEQMKDVQNENQASMLFYVCELMMRDVIDIKETTSWRLGDFKNVKLMVFYPDNLVLNLWDHLIQAFVLMNMTLESIYDIYKMKHEKNILRQKNGYSVANKTEDDNNEIKDKI